MSTLAKYDTIEEVKEYLLGRHLIVEERSGDYVIESLRGTAGELMISIFELEAIRKLGAIYLITSTSDKLTVYVRK
jgi:hypothetical protein